MEEIGTMAAIMKKDDFHPIARQLKGEFAGLWESPRGKHLGRYE